MVIENLDVVKAEPPLLAADSELAQTLYKWALRFPGGGIDKLMSESAIADRILAARIRKAFV